MNKGLGWGAIPREIFTEVEDDSKRKEWILFVRRMMENIINSGNLPSFLNKTRLVVLNKLVGEVPRLDKLRPIQISEIFKLILEILVEPEVKKLCRRNDLVSQC